MTLDGIWAALVQKVDFASFVPRPIEGIERADLPLVVARVGEEVGRKPSPK